MAVIAWTSLVEAFDAAQDDVPTLFIAWTIKGFGLPFAGHKDNHAGLMNPTQMSAARRRWASPRAANGSRFEGVGDNARTGVEALIERSRIAREKRPRIRLGSKFPRSRAVRRGTVDPGRVRPDPRSRSPRPAAASPTIVTTSPDVTVSTNLGAWVNQRGLFRR